MAIDDARRPGRHLGRNGTSGTTAVTMDHANQSFVGREFDHVRKIAAEFAVIVVAADGEDWCNSRKVVHHCSACDISTMNDAVYSRSIEQVEYLGWQGPLTSREDVRVRDQRQPATIR